MSVHAHVAIDGPAGSGKTTVARALAGRLGILYLDTGAMYRAVALLGLRAAADIADPAAMLALARAHPIGVVLDATAPFGSRIYAGAERLSDAELHGNEVSRVVSVVAAHPAIRELMVAQQRAIAREGPVIMAGRDIGTVVLPDAPFKIFLTAALDKRVERRLAELRERGSTVDPTVLRNELEGRDRLDQTRATAPLRPAPGAIEIDSSGTSAEGVVERIAALVRADVPT